jgi:hypothetical protein
MAVDLKLNKGNRKVTVTVTFDADPQLESPGLTRPFIEAALFNQAARLCDEAARQSASDTAGADIDAEAANKKAVIDAEAAWRKANKPTSDV